MKKLWKNTRRLQFRVFETFFNQQFHINYDNFQSWVMLNFRCQSSFLWCFYSKLSKRISYYDKFRCNKETLLSTMATTFFLILIHSTMSSLALSCKNSRKCFMILWILPLIKFSNRHLKTTPTFHFIPYFSDINCTKYFEQCGGKSS